MGNKEKNARLKIIKQCAERRRLEGDLAREDALSDINSDLARRGYIDYSIKKGNQRTREGPGRHNNMDHNDSSYKPKSTEGYFQTLSESKDDEFRTIHKRGSIRGKLHY